MKRKPFKIRRWLVVGVAAGALGVTAAAQARPIIDTEPGPPVSVRQYLPADLVDSATDGAAVATQYWTAADAYYKKQAAQLAGASDVVATHSPPAVSDSSGGFNWGDFAIGIGAALGVMLVAAVMAQFARNRRGLATLH
jgi:hypothetical protein